jgi:glycosyltransferase involved in cell wall biosynthesis
MTCVSSPFLSIIVPAHQGESVLRRSLAGLMSSRLERSSWELIVVDDASTDKTSLVAAEYADVVVRLPGNPHGPAYARNRGFEASRGEVLVFVDADVVVRPDTLSSFAALFASPGAPSAAFGSYDAQPASPGLVSQYRNLLHHYVHQRAGGPAETFWAGCGAIRRRDFVRAGLFDEVHYARPQIEDIELGRRMRRLGMPIVLAPEIQATHLKRWTFRDVVRTDLWARGVPWMRLILREGRTAGSRALNVGFTEKICTALAGLAIAGVTTGVLTRWAPATWLAIAAVAIVLTVNRDFYRFLALHRGFWFASRAVPLHFAYYALNGFAAAIGLWQHYFGEAGGNNPPSDTHRPLGAATWPPTPIAPAGGIWTPEAGSNVTAVRS